VPALDDRLVVTAGVRYTEEEKGIDYDYGAYQTPFGSVPARALSRERNFYNLSMDASVSYRFTDGINGFVRYADAYRSGGFNGEIFDNPYDEETIEQFEVGVKSEWLDQRLRVNASWYTYEGTDLQASVIRVANNTATSSVVNAGEASRWGTDLEVLAAPIDDLTLGLGWSYISGDFDKFPPTCTGATPPVCLNTNNLAKSSAPDNQVSATMDYTFARTDMGAFGLYLQYNYQDESGTAPITTGLVSANVNVPGSPQVPYEYARQILPSRNLVNARLSWSEIPIGNESLRLTLWGRNLLDEDINVYGINFAALGLYTEQFIEPLTFGIEAAYEF
ncbi:MAG: TonB-dependent receptor, partial [Steroidobacteraceae bacterium]|nr:TonB-dependent receptor [Steroidobacteraceae bacterium]